jgi:anti-sigma B factor antagonist
MTDARYYLRGEIDLAQQDRVRDEIAAAIDPPTDLLIDCAHLTFLDSSGVALLVEARQSVESSGHNMLLVNMTGAPLRVLEILNLADLLSIDRTDGDQPIPSLRREQEELRARSSQRLRRPPVGTKSTYVD